MSLAERMKDRFAPFFAWVQRRSPARIQVCARPAADLRRHPWVLADPRLLDAAAWFHGGGDGCAVVSALALSSASAPGNAPLTSLQLAVFRPAPVYPAAHLRLPVPVAHAINAKFHPRQSNASCFGNRLFAFRAMGQALTHRRAAGFQPRQFVRYGCFDLFAYRAITRPSTCHATASYCYAHH